MLEMALDTILEVVVAGVTAIVGNDIAMTLWGSGHERGGCRLIRGAVDLSGSICYHLDSTGHCSRVLPTFFVITGSCDVAAAVGGGGGLGSLLGGHGSTWGQVPSFARCWQLFWSWRGDGDGSC